MSDITDYHWAGRDPMRDAARMCVESNPWRISVVLSSSYVCVSGLSGIEPINDIDGR